MRALVFSSMLVIGALSLTGCQKPAEDDAPPVEDLGEDDGSSQDLPELEAAEAKRKSASRTTSEPTDDGGSQDDYGAAGEVYTDEPTDNGGSQDDYGAAGPP